METEPHMPNLEKDIMNSQEKIKAVIFDLDDTLISEKQYIESGFMHIAKVLSKKTDFEKQYIYNVLMDLFRSSAGNVFNRMFEKLNIPYKKEDILKLVEIYRNHEPDIRFYDDVLPCLERLKLRGLKTGIITDGYVVAQRNKLRVLNAGGYFNHIVVTGEIGEEYCKPHPRPFEVMREKLEVEFNEMMYVGDNPEKDFFIGSIYPIKTVRICRDGGVYEGRKYLLNVREHTLIYSLDELIRKNE